MNWEIDWKTLIMLGVIIFNAFIFVVIKFNDLRHISKDTDEIKTKMDKIFRRLGRVEKEIVKREAICNERHKK